MNLDWLDFFDSFSFLWAWMLAFLPLPWIIRLILPPASQKQLPLFAPHLMARLSKSARLPSLEANGQQRRIPWLFVLLWLFLVLAAMRPVWFLTPAAFTQTGKDMMLAVDLSGSMEKNDMTLNGRPVDRLTSVKTVVSQFIKKRQGDRMGLVVFGTQAFLQSPLTYDLKTVESLLNETEIGMAGNNTAIGDAIGITLKHLRQANQKNAVMILLTDGSNTAGTVQPIDAAKQAKKMGLKIYTIGIGQSQESAMNVFFGGSDMDLATLKNIAKITGGKFFYAADTDKLNEVYASIDKLESTPHLLHQYRMREELFVWPLGLALLLSLLMVAHRLYRSPMQHSATTNTPDNAESAQGGQS
ncbi:vWA domain-containing protein [Hydrogenovibrio marinus]|uniref:von Willebrand factor A n=1 Tax=Hydrogenovibrio marinus TaxID=28885 RepID=A0A066ZUR8_HYDMR|nr:VWA domain-containing protein [Hydrogenovibrio marinus]KDN96024.1 von Willebrand factor A [Hydrogenovibrio marinus]BBN58479.1 VWA domain-containing protein [Hydrogenovibrio marinus]